jgi:hypothetical protein
MNWKRKLSSRKMWAAVIGVVLSVMTMYGSSEDDKAKVTGLITSCGVLIAYIVGEGLIDKENKDE